MSTDNFVTFASGTEKEKNDDNAVGGGLSSTKKNQKLQPALVINYCTAEPNKEIITPDNNSNVVTFTNLVSSSQSFNLTAVLDYVVNILKVRNIVVKTANMPANAINNLEMYISEIAESPVIKQLWNTGEELFVHGYFNENKIATLSSKNNIITSSVV